MFYNILELLIAIFLITILYNYDIIGEKLFSLLKLIILLSSIFINSFILSLSTKNKKIVEGIKYGLLIVFILFIGSLLLNNIRPRLLIYYLMIILSSIFGSSSSVIKKESK